MLPVIRRRELADLRSQLATHRAVALTGGLGSGRRSLLRALESGWEGTVIRVASSPLDADTAYSGVDGLLTALGALDDGASITEDPRTDIGPRAAAAFHSAPVGDNTLLLIPNADELDPASQRVIGQILRRRRSVRLSTVITARSLPDGSPLAALREIAMQDLSIVELTELARELATARHGHTAIAEEAALVAARAAAGRPSALRHIIEEMAPSEMRGEIALSLPVRVGSASRGMVAELVGELGDESEAILRSLSLAPLTPVRPLANRMPGFWEAVDELESRGAIERRGAFLCIPHGLVRASAQQSMDSRERRTLHMRLAQDCAGIWPQLEAWHTSFVDPGEETPVRLAAHAAGLIRRGLVSGGVEFAERAIRVCADLDGLHEPLLDIAESLTARGEFVFATRYTRMTSQSMHAGVVVRARTLDTRIAFLSTQVLPSPLLSRWSRRETEEAPAEVARLQLNLALGHCERGEYDQAQDLAQLAEAADARLGQGERQLSAAVRIQLDSHRGVDASALAGFTEVQKGQSDLEPRFVLAVASGLMLTEHHELAAAVLDQLREVHGPATIWRRQADCLQAEMEIRQGRIGQALDLITRISADADSGARRGSAAIRQDRLLVLRVWQLLMTGRAGDAEPVEEETARLASATGNRRLLAELNAVQGRYLLHVGCPAEAVRHLRRCEELSGAEVNPTVRRFEGDLIEALVSLGRREHATLLLSQLRKRAERSPSRWAEQVVGRCEALLSAGSTCDELFGRALRRANSLEFVYEKARTHAAYAARLADNGSGRRAHEQELAAAALLREVGAERLAERFLAERSDSPEPATTLTDLPRLGELSDEELKVVELVRAGLKNREIAERVFVSLRTVELRLTAVYRKLDVGSRTELVSRLAGNPRLAAV